MSTVGKPSMTEAIAALSAYPSATTFDGSEMRADDLLEIIDLTVDAHWSPEANADRHRHYGHCVGCGEPWPCLAFTTVQSVATEWLARAAHAIARRNGLIRPALPIQGRQPGELPMLDCYWCLGGCTHDKGGSTEPERPRLIVISNQPLQLPGEEPRAIIEVKAS